MKPSTDYKSLSLKLSIQYAIVLGSFWAVFCSFYSYATVYLLSRGFTSSVVGLLIALGNVAGLILQPILASMADREDKITLHGLLCILAALMAGLSLILYLIPVPMIPTALLFILMDSLMWILMPLTNALSFYYINRRIPVEFGVPRGIGSITYAIVSGILGIVVVPLGAGITMVFTAGLLLLMITAVISMPKFPEIPLVSTDNSENTEDSGILTFFRRYPVFTLTLIGFTAIFTFHNMSNNNMIYLVEHLGGDAGNLGTLFSIQAMVELPAMFGITLLLKKFSSSTLMKCAAVFFVLKALAFILSFNIPVLYAAQIFQGGSYALFIPTSVYYVNEIMSNADKVKGQAFINMTNTLGGVFGSLLGGFLIQYAGLYVMMNTGLMLAAVGAVLVLVFIKKR